MTFGLRTKLHIFFVEKFFYYDIEFVWISSNEKNKRGLSENFIRGNIYMSENKKIENLDGFKDMRIVDNFYQTSSFFPNANNR